MATYTAAQLYGTGSIGENFVSKSFIFHNSDNYTNYFTLEAIATPNGFYNSESAIISSGSFVISSSMIPGFITSSNIFSFIIPPGTSSFNFTSSVAMTGSTYRLRGTGNYSLTIA